MSQDQTAPQEVQTTKKLLPEFVVAELRAKYSSVSSNADAMQVTLSIIGEALGAPQGYAVAETLDMLINPADPTSSPIALTVESSKRIAGLIKNLNEAQEAFSSLARTIILSAGADPDTWVMVENFSALMEKSEVEKIQAANAAASEVPADIPSGDEEAPAEGTNPVDDILGDIDTGEVPGQEDFDNFQAEKKAELQASMPSAEEVMGENPLPSASEVLGDAPAGECKDGQCSI